MEVYENPFHASHAYLRIGEDEASSLDVSVFDELLRTQGRPLQVMAASGDKALTALLEKAGFVLKRRCFEMDVSAADLVAPLPEGGPVLDEARRGTEAYERCAQAMFAYYAETHAAVSPLTASREEFCAMLPDTVLYAEEDGVIAAAAFVEDSEIAYLCAASPGALERFAPPLLRTLFARYECLVFEADDCDPAATQLRALFNTPPAPSWDTWVKTP